MSVLGSSERWREALVDVYDLVHATILRVWPDCRSKLQIQELSPPLKRRSRKRKAQQPYEDPITRSLIVQLRRDDAIRRRLIVNSQVELLPSSPELAAEPIGYLDIAIEFFAHADQLCLSVECKRLNVLGKRFATLAGPYVEQGMMRFVNGQYSPSVSLGGMIGYVMNSDVEAAYKAVREQIESRAEALLCDTSTIIDADKPVHFCSTHSRAPVPIEIRHLLLSMN